MSPQDISNETRAIKRVRLACSNCRRKKVRCSGERPTCSFCDKLSQPCQYVYYRGQDRNHGEATENSDDLNDEENELLLRVKSLESRLAEMVTASARISVPDNLVLSSALRNRQFSANETRPSFNRPGVGVGNYSVDAGNTFHLAENSWQHLPPQYILIAACDVFFLHCYNQPYTFFNEATFRRQLKNREIPDHLLYAFVASTLRYSADPLFRGKQVEALEGYAKSSWDIIMSRGFVVAEDLEISVIQTISLLAVIDSAAGRRRAAWVKIGLAVRISQDLGLIAEPDQSLSIIEQEERRRLFWSVYLLDRFVSCSKQRPSIILDEDCQVRLPCDESSFRDGVAQETGYLMPILSGKGLVGSQPGGFSLAVVAASVLGRCARYSLDIQQSDPPIPPWDPRSDYIIISSMLTEVESFLQIENISIAETLRERFTLGETIDQPTAGHFILHQALFHLSHCLLNHPFLLRQRIASIASKVPVSWLSHSLESCLVHARAMSSLFRDAKDAGCIVSTSFYGYCALVSGGIHALHVNSSDEFVREESMRYLRFDVRFLEELSAHWMNTALIATGLKCFWTISSYFKELISTAPQIRPLEYEHGQIFWSIIDYGIMSNPLNFCSIATTGSYTGVDIDTWFDSESARVM